MAAPRTRAEFKDYCLRRLGWPVLDINVDDDQVEDRIDDALAFWQDYHYDGTEKIYMKHLATEIDIARGWIPCPEPVTFVTQVFPWDDSNSSVNMFDLRYQLRLHDLYDFTSVSYVSYEITMQHIRSLNMLFSGTPQFRFNRHHNKLFLDIDWGRDVAPGEYIIVECYRKMMPDIINLTGTVTTDSSSKTLLGVGTNFSQELLEGDIFIVNNETLQVQRIISPTELTLVAATSSSNSGLSISVAGNTDIWNDRFLKAYATAKIKQQWGNNLKKFEGIQMPGGVTLNGQKIYDEATDEIEKLEEFTFSTTSMPSEIFTG